MKVSVPSVIPEMEVEVYLIRHQKPIRMTLAQAVAEEMRLGKASVPVVIAAVEVEAPRFTYNPPLEANPDNLCRPKWLGLGRCLLTKIEMDTWLSARRRNSMQIVIGASSDCKTDESVARVSR
ncbi:hypothetical protein M5689_002254 [Euphorbia peplus]|nr:hypothetical protein M5689_002254 [Euphorbia peplus]